MEGKVWYVRSEEGAVYGPATAESLLDWARDGRIDPSGYVSKDRVNWVPPQTLDFLEMKWLVETELGKFFGPFNRELVKRLAADRQIPEGARVYRAWDLPVDKDPDPVIVEKIVEKVVEKPVEVIKEVIKEVRVEVPVEKIVEKVVEVPVEPPPRAAIVVPEVVEAIDAPPPRPKLGGIFKDASPDKLAALEAAARRELSAARKFGIGGFFGRK